MVVVSEETAQISLAHRGEFVDRGITGDELRERLQQIFERVRGLDKEIGLSYSTARTR